ncbi:tetratricopeptide (TPR) repeat protein [Paraburkholderia sp. GAS448]|uniref:hypothetical protein n=1 Tax=Paraburkholderia sp. GAS448 TaxID=3035136 RepID=UPI003D1B7578
MLRARIGSAGAKVALILLVVVVPFVWSNWARVREWPVLNEFVDWVSQPTLPHAKPGEYSIVIARLSDDNDRRAERLVEASLEEIPAVHVYVLGRRISQKGVDATAGETQAQDYLRKTGAQILLWGKVVPRLDGKDSPMLNWAVAPNLKPAYAKVMYQAEGGGALPKLFWEDLAVVLRLLIAKQLAQFVAQSGAYDADKLEPFIVTLRTLVDERTGHAGQWKPETLAAVRVILADSLVLLAEQSGNSEDLAEAIANYREALLVEVRTEAPLEREQLERAQLRGKLADALVMLGAAQAGTALLEEAVGIFSETLNQSAVQQNPFTSALMLNGLGIALLTLAERESGTKRAEEAVAAFRAARKEWTSESHGRPLLSSDAEENLCNALSVLGQRESGTAHMVEAVDVCREAVTEYADKGVPLTSAQAQQNLGIALLRLGERDGDADRLREAATAFHAALDEYTQARTPVVWARIQSNLGITLATLARLDDDMAQRVQAADACRAALTALSRERTPLDWAKAQYCLGTVLVDIGIRKDDLKALKEARGALERVISVLQVQAQDVSMRDGAQAGVDVANIEIERLTACRAGPSPARRVPAPQCN